MAEHINYEMNNWTANDAIPIEGRDQITIADRAVDLKKRAWANSHVGGITGYGAYGEVELMLTLSTFRLARWAVVLRKPVLELPQSWELTCRLHYRFSLAVPGKPLLVDTEKPFKYF